MLSSLPSYDAAATVTVYAVTGVAVCSPDDPSWEELEESRVVLDDEDLRIRATMTPAVDSFDLCRRAFGSNLLVATSETCPAAVAIEFSESDFMQFGDHSERRTSLGDVDAWMKANEDNRVWNACAIVKGEKHVHFKQLFPRNSPTRLMNDHAKET